MDYLGGWSYEKYRGVGPAQQHTCKIPMCGRPVSGIGLCVMCGRAFYRGGERALTDRARRLARGETYVDPRYIKGQRGGAARLIQYLENAALALNNCDSEDDDEYFNHLAHLAKVAVLCGEHLSRQMIHTYVHRYKYIKKHGVVAWRQKEANRKRNSSRERQDGHRNEARRSPNGSGASERE